MNCNSCGSGQTRIYDSRPVCDGFRKIRRHVCGDCGNRFITYEIYNNEYFDKKLNEYNQQMEVDRD